MDSLVFDAHDDRPPRVFPVDGQSERRGVDNLQHDVTHRLAVVHDFLDGRPFVVRFIEVVPAHFIDADGKNRFERLVDSFAQQSCEQELVHKKGRRMPQIEDEGVTQADGFLEVRVVAVETFEQRFVAIGGAQKVCTQTRPHLIGAFAVKQRGSIEDGRRGGAEYGAGVSAIHEIISRSFVVNIDRGTYRSSKTTQYDARDRAIVMKMYVPPQTFRIIYVLNFYVLNYLLY